MPQYVSASSGRTSASVSPGTATRSTGRRDPRLQLRRQLRLEPQRLERRVADRLGAERVEPGSEVPVRAVRLDERHRSGDAAEELQVDGLRGRGRRGRGSLVPVAAPDLAARELLEQAGDPRVRRDELGIPALEERAPLRTAPPRGCRGTRRARRARSRHSGRQRLASYPAPAPAKPVPPLFGRLRRAYGSHTCVVPGAPQNPCPGAVRRADASSAPAAWRRRRSRCRRPRSRSRSAAAGGGSSPSR